jgi:hypothetical protein
MTLTPDRWITASFRRSDNRFYTSALDAHNSVTYFFFTLPNGTASVPATRLDYPGIYVSKKELPDPIAKAIIAYLAELEKNYVQTVMKL